MCDLYEREIGTIYPIVEMREVKDNLGSLYSAYEAMKYSPGSHKPGVQVPENMVDSDVQTLKLILAITLLAEGGGRLQWQKRCVKRFNSSWFSQWDG